MRKKLVKIIDSKRVLTSPEELLTYSYDATEHRCIPVGVLRPINEEEVVKIVQFAMENKIPITPRGAGTSLSGCSVPCEGGLVIDFSLMDGIKDVDEENSFVIIEPGIVYSKLNQALKGKSLFFPPDPGSGEVCTIGGMVSTNASGIRAVKYGTTKDYVKRLRVVLASGEAVTLGSFAQKSSSGYEMLGLFVGSEGTLGIVTEITLKLKRLPTDFKAATISFNSLEDAGKAVGEIISNGLDPSVIEIMDKETLRVVKMFQDTDAEGGAHLLIEMDGFKQIDVADRLDRAIQICRDNGASMVKIAKDDDERESLWKARKAALPSLARYKPTLILEDVTVPISKLPAMLNRVQEISTEHGVEIATFGHAGDGNLHPTILVNQDVKGEMEKAKKALEEIFKSALEFGGTLTGEHGIGLSKKHFLALEHGKSVELMKKIKEVLDPENILNPGKIF